MIIVRLSCIIYNVIHSFCISYMTYTCITYQQCTLWLIFIFHLLSSRWVIYLIWYERSAYLPFHMFVNFINLLIFLNICTCDAFNYYIVYIEHTNLYMLYPMTHDLPCMIRGNTYDTRSACAKQIMHFAPAAVYLLFISYDGLLYPIVSWTKLVVQLVFCLDVTDSKQSSSTLN